MGGTGRSRKGETRQPNSSEELPMVRAFTGCVPSLVCPPARGLPCERFTAVLTDRTSCITRGRGGWLDLPRGGLAPPILCQLSWRALLRVMSAVFAMSATSPVYLRLRKDCGSAANRRCGPGAAVETQIFQAALNCARVIGDNAGCRRSCSVAAILDRA